MRATATACRESLGTVRINSPLSGKSSSESAAAVGEHVSTSFSTATLRVPSSVVDEVGPMIASTPCCTSVCTDTRASAAVSPSSSTTTCTGWPSTPPAALISLTARFTAARIESPSSGATPPRGSTAPNNRAPSSDDWTVVEATVSVLGDGDAESLHEATSATEETATTNHRVECRRLATGRVYAVHPAPPSSREGSTGRPDMT